MLYWIEEIIMNHHSIGGQFILLVFTTPNILYASTQIRDDRKNNLGPTYYVDINWRYRMKISERFFIREKKFI